MTVDPDEPSTRSVLGALSGLFAGGGETSAGLASLGIEQVATSVGEQAAAKAADELAAYGVQEAGRTGPGDGFCCPSQQQTRTFRLAGDVLALEGYLVNLDAGGWGRTGSPALPIAGGPGAETCRPQETVVAFEYPADRDQLFLQRCIAIGGQTVKIEDGVVYVDGIPFDEPEGVLPMPEDFGPEVVPDGHFFVMGDNRPGAFDSRTWGTVALDHLRGRVVRELSWREAAAAWIPLPGI